jgi:hypothetical protein
MSPDANDADLLRLINGSGFLFQLRVEDEVRRTSQTHQKHILAREHRWKDEATGEEGFIDLIMTTGTNGKMVVECKRTRDANWVFLVPTDARIVGKANVLWTGTLPNNRKIAAWDNLELNPASFESSFCVIRGQGEGDAPMLERISGILLGASESLAAEELKYPQRVGVQGLRFYFPVIVTNAKLKICRCDFSAVDLSTGTIPGAVFEDVAFLRFAKSMSTRLQSSRPPNNLAESARESQRTVFIMNAETLPTSLLGNWEFYTLEHQPDQIWPWSLPIWNAAE